MDVAHLTSITDAQRLHEIVAEKIAEIAQRDVCIAQQRALLDRRDQTIVYKEAKLAKLTAEILRLRRVQFAPRTEKMDAEQRALFDEAMATDLAAVEAELEEAHSDANSKPAKPNRAIPKRRRLPPELPRIETRHEPESCACGTCGAALVPIGEHLSEKLDCEPLKFFVRRDVYPQYACRACEKITAEPVAPAILDRGIAAPGLLAQVVIAKYIDHLPLHRQEAIHQRSGIEVGRTTLAEWCGVVGLRLQPLVDALRAELLQSPVLHADETPVAQLDPGAGKTKRAHLFAYRTASQVNPIVVFDYAATRSGKHAAAFLGDWRGALMVDDFAGYKALFAHGTTELGWWAHARRKFVDLHQASGSPIANEAIQRIAALYRIEAEARDLDPDQRQRLRQQHARPRIDALKHWLTALRPQVLGAGGTLAAIDYTLKRWAALTRYLDDGRFPIDNNLLENAIRPIALGRRNWLFAGSETAGRRAAAIMSLLATAKANCLEPHAWLTDVLTRLPTTLDRDIATLLPHRWRPHAP